jgi:hypothetical protein
MPLLYSSSRYRTGIYVCILFSVVDPELIWSVGSVSGIIVAIWFRNFFIVSQFYVDEI